MSPCGHLSADKSPLPAYNHAISDMLLPSVILCLVPLIAGALTSNYALDDRHNAVEDKKVVVREQDELEATLRA